MNRSHFAIRLSIAAVALAAFTSQASAGLGEFFVLENHDGGLYRGQTGSNASDIMVGPLAGPGWFDLAPGFDASFVFAMHNHTLLRLSTTDGGQISSVNPDRDFVSIATDTATSTVYAVVESVPGTPQFAELITVDPVTGQTTTIGQLGGGTDGLSLVGLGFDPITGGLFLTAQSGELFSIDANTGAASFVGNTGLSQPFDVDYNPADGQMYVTDAGHDQLFLLNRADAGVTASTLYANLNYSTGLAFAIPAPGSVALLSLCGLGAMRRRR